MRLDTQSDNSTLTDSNTVVMRGIVSFKQFFPEWKGHWNYLMKDNRDTVNRSQTISYKRSSRVWPFIPEDEKQNFDIFTESNRKGIKQAYPDYEHYLSSHLKKYACEFCGLWEGLFYMENSRIPIKETFRLGIAYCGSTKLFSPKAIPNDCLNYSEFASHLLEGNPLSGIIVLHGVGENEFGLFKALVCINPDKGVMTTIKCYFHDQLSSSTGFLVGTSGCAKGDTIEAIKKRLLDPSNRKRQLVKSEVIVDVCDVCNSPSEKGSAANSNHNNQLITCTQCGVRVHPTCYGIDITNTTIAIYTRYWVCDPCMYKAWDLVKGKQTLCALCHFPGGALKRSVEGEWCHLSCMLYSNHISVLSYAHMEPIIVKNNGGEAVPLSTLPHHLFSHICCICKQAGGLTEKCCVNGCFHYMHGRCLRHYQSSKLNHVKNYSIYVFRDDEGYRNVKYYCPLHGVSKDTVEERSEGTICNGIFTVAYQDNEVYKGEIHNDKREGYGEYYFSNGIVYRGEWYNDKEHGKGEYHRGDDIIYKGDFADGRMNGYGVYYYDNGDIYDGYFREGLRCNNGIYLFHNGTIYEGEWKDDRRHGVGTLIDTKGNTYSGEWKNDFRDGKGDLVCKQKRTRLVDRDTGEETFPKQQRLISHMSDRIKEAEEALEKRIREESERRIEEETVEETVKYSGQFKTNYFEGAGSLYYGTGDSYKGMFHGNLRDGRGTYHFRNYSLYEGHFREDRIEGVGTVTIAKNVKAKRDEIFIPIVFPQGSIKEVHKSAGFEENGT